MVLAIISFAHGDKSGCLKHVTNITVQLRPLLSSYYDHLHDKSVARSVWLSHVQGFFAWGIGHVDGESQEWIQFDGLSGNQVLLFQALDAFLGLEPYLSRQVQERNVPKMQRTLCEAFRKHSFRDQLDGPLDGIEAKIAQEFTEIVKRLRVCLTIRCYSERVSLSKLYTDFQAHRCFGLRIGHGLRST
jgi:hypothetical protein